MRIKIALAIGSIAFMTGLESTQPEPERTIETQKEQPESTPQKMESLPVVFFTTFNAGAIEQNDSAPCHSASGKDICNGLRNGESHVAIAKDLRQKLQLKWGDKVRISGGVCSGVYSVEDEMGKRFRSGCIKRGGYCIKGDVAVPKESKKICDGAYSIEKL